MSINDLKSIIQKSDNIVFFGGAGVSTESGIPDFRSEAGLCTTSNNLNQSPEYMLSHTCFKKDTDDFFDFYKTKMIYLDAKPNLAHNALVELEKRGKLKAIITQNIDGLHQIAGSKNVLELHGSVYRNYCVKCNKTFNIEYVIESKKIPICDSCGGVVRPEVVLYEEGLDMDVMNKAIQFINNADVLIVGGTSLAVYPAAGLINYYNGDKLILINKSKTQYDNKAMMTFTEGIGSVLNEVINY